MRVCDRCGGMDGMSVQLVGGFYTNLCNGCLNVWHVMYRASEEAKLMLGLEAWALHMEHRDPKLNSAVGWTDYTEDREALLSRCFTMAEAFCKPLAEDQEVVR